MPSITGRLTGGSPAMVALWLIVASFIVGVVLAAFGFSSASLLSEAARAARRLFEIRLTDVRQLGRILLTGAMVVVPVWLALRLVQGGR
jgi:uncharacterized membrane protein